jgi:hypothetical protein
MSDSLLDADFEEVAEERRGDRRRCDRRRQHRLDPFFAATLIAQVEPLPAAVKSYPGTVLRSAGAAINLRA